MFELEAFLEKGAMVKLDCMRLPSPMVPAMPHTILKIEPEGYPGVAFHWLEVEGPFIEEWPPASYRALFGDVPFEQEGRHVVVISEQPLQDAGKLLAGFMERAYRRPVTKAEFNRFHQYAKQLLKEEETFTDAMIATYSACWLRRNFSTTVGNQAIWTTLPLLNVSHFFSASRFRMSHSAPWPGRKTSRSRDAAS